MWEWIRIRAREMIPPSLYCATRECVKWWDDGIISRSRIETYLELRHQCNRAATWGREFGGIEWWSSYAENCRDHPISFRSSKCSTCTLWYFDLFFSNVLQLKFNDREKQRRSLKTIEHTLQTTTDNSFKLLASIPPFQNLITFDRLWIFCPSFSLNLFVIVTRNHLRSFFLSLTSLWCLLGT